METACSFKRNPDETGRLLVEQKILLELIATGVPLDECLTALCNSVARLSPGTRACVMLADEARLTFSRSISPDLPTTFCQGLAVASINGLAMGTGGEALYRGRRVGCSDISREGKWSQAWRSLCISHGVKACVSEPIFDAKGDPFGSMMLCFSEPREPTEWELRMLCFAIFVASIALAREQTTKALLQSEERYRNLFSSINVGFCVMEACARTDGETVDFRFLEANFMFETITGLKNFKGRTLLEVGPSIEEGWLQTFMRVAITGEPVRMEQQACGRWFKAYCYRVDKPADRRIAVLFDDISSRKRVEENLEFLASVSHDLTSAKSVCKVMETVGAKLSKYLDLSVCSFVENNHAADQATISYEWHREELPSTVGVHSISDFCTEEFKIASNKGEAFVVNDTMSDLRVSQAFEALGLSPFFCVPIIRNGEWRFSLCVLRSEPHQWREDEIELVQRLAKRIFTRLERVRTEEALYESERKLRQIFEGAKDYAIYSTDPRGYITSWSPGAERLFGYTEQEAMGQSGEMVFTTMDRDEQIPQLEMEQAKSHGVAEDERWHQRKDGTAFFASGLTQPIFDLNRCHLGYTKICRDPTAHQQAREYLERELIDSQRLQEISARLVAEGDFASLLQEILDTAVAVTHSEMGAVQLVEENLGGELLLLNSAGFDSDALAAYQGQGVHGLAPQMKSLRRGERVVITDLLRSVRLLAVPCFSRLVSAGVRASQWTPLTSRSGKLLGIISTHWRHPHQPGERELRLLDLLARQAVDFIERNQSQAALREHEQKLLDLSRTLEGRVEQRTAELQKQTARLQSLAAELASAEQRERKRLAALLHDDLQQLLVAASMQLDLARGGNINFRDEALSQAAQWIEEARNSARNLTCQLRPPALYEDGLLAALHWLASEMYKLHHLEVSIDGSEPAQTLSDDIKALLFECIRELLFNVAKYAGVTCAKVALRETGGVLRIIVTDQGVGFDVESVGTARHSGGFGLFSIRERLIALGGEMVMDSTFVSGSTIELHVPIMNGTAISDFGKPIFLPAPILNSGKLLPAPAYDSRIQVLVVDDHPMVREGIANILGGDSRLVVSAQAADGVEAIHAVERFLPDVVLMDVNMPNMNGIEATREICRRWPETRIIGLSVQDDPTTAKSMRDAGAADFISKSGASAAMVAAILAQMPHKVRDLNLV